MRSGTFLSAPAALLAAMRGSWRTALRAAERPRPTLGLDRPARSTRFSLAEERQRRARGYRALPAAFTRAPAARRAPVWDWREGGETQAAMAFVRHGATASYHLGWTGPAGRAGEAHRALLWAAALALRSDGVRWLDLAM